MLAETTQFKIILASDDKVCKRICHYQNLKKMGYFATKKINFKKEPFLMNLKFE